MILHSILNQISCCDTGLTIGKKEDKLGIRASSTCSIFLENVHVTRDNLLGKEGDGFKIAMSSIS